MLNLKSAAVANVSFKTLVLYFQRAERSETHRLTSTDF